MKKITVIFMGLMMGLVATMMTSCANPNVSGGNDWNDEVVIPTPNDNSNENEGTQISENENTATNSDNDETPNVPTSTPTVVNYKVTLRNWMCGAIDVIDVPSDKKVGDVIDYDTKHSVVWLEERSSISNTSYYSFYGWMDKNGNDIDDDTPITDNMTLYAKYKHIFVYNKDTKLNYTYKLNWNDHKRYFTIKDVFGYHMDNITIKAKVLKSNGELKDLTLDYKFTNTAKTILEISISTNDVDYDDEIYLTINDGKNTVFTSSSNYILFRDFDAIFYINKE